MLSGKTSPTFVVPVVDSSPVGLRSAKDAKRVPLSWVLLALTAVLLRLVFWQFTGRVWEDALISVLHSENVFRGIGLTHFHRNGIPVHGFTSPLSVLIPLMGDFLRVGSGLALIKAASALAGGMTVLLGMFVARQLGLSNFLIWIAGLYLACEYHQILWGMAGMETQLATAILLASILILNGHGSPVATGLVMALCLLARPDFLMWICIICGVLAWRCYENRTQLRKLLKTLAVVALAYTPWLLFTTLYYGSFVPNTIRAKSAGYPLWSTSEATLSSFIREPPRRFVKAVFAPLGFVYGGNGTGFVSFDRHVVEVIAAVLVVLGTVLGFWLKDKRMIPISLFLCTYSVYIVFFVPYIFGWYCIPICAVGVLAALFAVHYMTKSSKLRSNVVHVLLVIYIVVLVCLLPKEFQSERNIQTYIEDGTRKQMALYIGTHSTRNETVGLEPLGYMSYYSGREVFDYPGLVNRETVRLLQNHPDARRLDGMLRYRRPDWIVLRKSELKKLFDGKSESQWFRESYVRVKEFKTDPHFWDSVIASGENVDTDFVVFRKKQVG